LMRLDNQVYLITYSGEFSGRLRKYYRITDLGIRRLNEYIQELMELKRVIDAVTGGNQNGE